MKKIIETLFKCTILSNDEYEDLIFSRQRSLDKLRSIKKAYTYINNPLVQGAEERMIELIKSI